MHNHSVNFASNMRWVVDVPLKTLFPDESDITLNLYQFDIPEIDMGITSMAYQGSTIEYPTGVIQPDDKTCTFNYILDSDMTVYWLLYKWCSYFTSENVDFLVEDDTSMSTEPFTKKISISVYILDEFKNPVMKITYNNCFIKNLGILSMSIQDEPTPLQHSFTIAYSSFNIEKITT